MDISKIEEYILQIQSVQACKVILDEHGNIDDIHVLSSKNRSPKQILRDIQTILISKFGLTIDYKKISIAQVEESMMDNDSIRVKIKSIEYSNIDSRSEVKVVLGKDETLFEGIASGPSTLSNNQRLVGKATLKAIESYCGTEGSLVLEDIRTSHVAGKEILISVVTAINQNMEQTLSGSAIIHGDIKEAAVKATLDAVNRTMSKLVG